MKKFIISLMMCSVLVVLLMSAKKNDGVITKENGMYVVNTTTLAADVDGYIGATPLKIYIKNNKIEKIEALKNQETPKYFAKVKKQVLDKWNGKTVKEALRLWSSMPTETVRCRVTVESQPLAAVSVCV